MNIMTKLNIFTKKSKYPSTSSINNKKNPSVEGYVDKEAFFKGNTRNYQNNKYIN